ncbi:hypothetical protein RvY_19210 [Ramazzottius varieornatus]|uniref:Uncharacterized protein n=1 Tax=Ramazzottius varieornatus TaxID=947166 RepID=A0A1D1W8P0_RAMVA|nr:hypothetical protein RvY_19210 [Ramazzottius varieornatus]
MALDGWKGHDFLWEAALSRRQRRERDSEAEKTVGERNGQRHYCGSCEVNPRGGRYERLLAVDDIHPYQYPPGKGCTLAWKVALRDSLRNTYQPTEPELMPETERQTKAQKKDAEALHSFRVVVERKVEEFMEKHPKRPRESGDLKDPVNIVDQGIQSLAEKDNQPSAVPKTDQRSPGAVNRDESLIRGMSTGNKATAPLCSVGDRDTSDGAEEHVRDVRSNLGKTLLRQVNNPATFVRA